MFKRVLYAPNTKNMQVHCVKRFKINVISFMEVKYNFYMETNSHGSVNFIKALCRFRMENMLNEEVKQLIDDAISNPN